MAAYEVVLRLLQRRSPERLARSVHAQLRDEWLIALAAQRGSEILAVQTLRNSVMSATMTASTAVLGLIGTVTLAAPSLNASLAASADLLPQITTRLMLELALMTLLFASLVCSAMSVRYYNLTGFVASLPVDSPQRASWAPAGKVYLRRAARLYSWGLRYLFLVAPVLASLVHPLAGPVAALLVIAVLVSFDRFPAATP
jgi:uncharacterized membrane protein